MRLPVPPPVKPMLSKSVADLTAVPDVPGLVWEPKWDGFRCIVFRDGDEIELGSRNDRPLTRYFPEILEPLKASLPDRCVVDGELVVVTGEGLDFDALQLRLHPAESRVRKLAAESPSSFVAFDLLAVGDRSLLDEPFRVRRAELVQAYQDAGGRPVGDLDYYVAFGYWKLACILEGVYTRYKAGAMGNDGADAEVFGDTVRLLGRASLDALDRMGG